MKIGQFVQENMVVRQIFGCVRGIKQQIISGTLLASSPENISWMSDTVLNTNFWDHYLRAPHDAMVALCERIWA